MKPLILSKKVPDDMDGRMLREFLMDTMRLSRTAVKKVKFNGGVLYVNGMSVNVRHILKKGDVVEVIFPPEENGGGIARADVPINLIYEDDCILVLNKPPGQPTVPSAQNRHATLANGVLYYIQEQGFSFTAHPVSRLDSNTSGLVIFAKHSVAHDWFSRMQKRGDLHREYLALVEGYLEQETGTIDAPIGRKEGSIIERCVTPDGKRAVTHYEVLRKFDGYSLVGIRLETGRTHQIRVHFSYLGHPLMGDDLYGGNMKRIGRHALHSHKLHFNHPLTDVPMAFQAPLPVDMRRLISESI